MRIFWKIKDWMFDIKMWWQKKTRGYSDVEFWNLNDYTCKWVLPRLRALRENATGHPDIPGECESMEQWQALMDEMIFGLEFEMKADDWYTEHVLYKSGEEKDVALELFNRMQARAQRGRELFGKWLTALWW